MSYILEEKVIKKLKNFFAQYSFIDKVMIFGSRAKGTNGATSDIDICLFSTTMSSQELSQLRFELDELPIFYHIDTVHFEKVDKILQANILKEGKVLSENF